MRCIVRHLSLASALAVATLAGCGEPTSPNRDAAHAPVAESAIEGPSSAIQASRSVGAAYHPRPVEPILRITAADRRYDQMMRQALAELREQQSVSNAYYGTARLKLAEQRLAAAGSVQDFLKEWIQLTLVQLELGNDAAALEAMQQTRQFFETQRDRFLPEDAAGVYYRFGLVNLRHAETQNCCLLHNKDSCLLPIRGGGVHTRTEGSRAAIAEFQKVVDLVPHDSTLYYEAVWLWNLAAMTLGQHPNGVPQEHRMAPEHFLSRRSFPRLMNMATELGLDQNSLSGSVVADDFNNDGYLDLMVGSFDLRESLRLYLSDGAGKFVDRSAEAGIEDMPGGLNMLQGDYNNDGRIDVYVLRGAWLFEDGKQPDSLLRNNGDGTFTDVTLVAGLAEENHPSQTAAWADYDLDGWLDLYVGGEEDPTNPAPCRLFHNNGDGTFTDVAESAGVSNHHYAKGVVWGDYNGDRYPDIYVSNLVSENRLFRNNGDGTFTDVAEEAGVADVLSSFPAWFWDYDNDGVLDLLVASFDGTIEDISRFYLGQQVDRGVPRVFRGTPEGVFVDMTKELGLEEPTRPMGSNFGDVNNDGYLDMYLGTGSPDFRMIMPNKLYLNDGGRRFEDVSEAAGLSHLQKGHGVAMADFDADGDQDVFIQMGGAYTVDKYVDALYENPGFGNSSASIELVGVESNRFGVGARIRIDIEENGEPRSIYRWVNSGGSFGCNPLRQQIGVGKAKRIERLEIYWPTTDQTQTFTDLPVNRILRVTEGADDYLEMTLRPASFLGSSL